MTSSEVKLAGDSIALPNFSHPIHDARPCCHRCMLSPAPLSSLLSPSIQREAVDNAAKTPSSSLLTSFLSSHVIVDVAVAVEQARERQRCRRNTPPRCRRQRAPLSAPPPSSQQERANDAIPTPLSFLLLSLTCIVVSTAAVVDAAIDRAKGHPITPFSPPPTKRSRSPRTNKHLKLGERGGP